MVRTSSPVTQHCPCVTDPVSTGVLAGMVNDQGKWKRAVVLLNPRKIQMLKKRPIVDVDDDGDERTDAIIW